MTPGTLAATGPRAPPARWQRALAPLAEALALAAVIAALWPAFDTVAGFGDGRDRRYAARGVEVEGLPDPVLPATCAAHAAAAEPALRERLCGTADRRAANGSTAATAVPDTLLQAATRAARAFSAPVADAQAHTRALRQRQREGVGDLRDTADRIAAIESDIAPHLQRFQLAADGDAGPLPLRCALGWLQATLAEPAADEATRAQALLLFAAALDGQASTAALAAPASLRDPRPVPAAAGCGAGPAAALATTAALLADARQSLWLAHKNEAMRALLRSAGLQWTAAMLLGFVLLAWSRRARSAAAGVGTTLLAWAGAAWAARVPWPLAGARSFEPARLDPGWTGAPAAFVLVLAGAGLLLLAAAGLRPAAAQRAAWPQAMSSRLGYPGLALATGLGWLLLLDLSAHGHPVNRYLALYHQGHLWLGLLVFSVLLFLRRPLAQALGRALALAGERRRRLAARLPAGVAALLLLAAAAAAVLAFGALLANLRQLTSELGRVWLIVGAAWFFFLRGGPLALRLADGGARHASIWRYAWPLLFVVGVLVAAMLATRDMGPLLIAAYASGAFIGAAAAMWWHARGAGAAAAFTLALGLFALWIAAVTAALFQAGTVDRVTAARLESLAAPLASNNDQLALVRWFQHAAPAQGHGLGAVPWCGHAPATQCAGVPAQVHSDYTFTALVGVFGAPAAWGLSLGAAFWLHRLVRRHGRVTRGEPRLVATGTRLSPDGQALLSWVAVGWVVLTMCQLAVTVAGNLAVLPLTGVTFPFVSYGMTSLVANLAFLALCLNVDLPARRA